MLDLIESTFEDDRGLVEVLAERRPAEPEAPWEPIAVRRGTDFWDVVEIVLVRTACFGEVEVATTEERRRTMSLGLIFSFLILG